MQDILNYLYNLERFGIKLGLEVITKLLDSLENPHKSFKSVHVAGTNGKGSTASFLAQILQEAGYKVGLYTSPHLIKFNERIRVNSKEITDEELIHYTKLIKEKAEQEKIQPTFFEFTTAIAFLHFANKKVDYAVIETGMGGKLDATNVIVPEVSIITNVSFDHMKHLGDTKEKIAAEKAGIIKDKGLLVTAEQDKAVLDIFKRVCAEKDARLLIVDEEIKYKIISSSLKKQKFMTSWKVSSTFTITLPGEFQIRNALLSILVADILGIPFNYIRKGLEKARWPCRLEVLSEEPLVIADCAHNVAGMRELSRFITRIPQRKILLLGIAEDKEIPEIISLIVPLADLVILSCGNYKPADLGILEKEVRKYTKNIKKFPKVEPAIKESLSLAKEDSMILVTGSIYLVGDVLKHKPLFRKIFK